MLIIAYNKTIDKRAGAQEVSKMKKYNLSQIMKDAWNYYRTFKRTTTPWNFSRCLKKAWVVAKEAVRVFTGLVRNVQVAGTLAHPILVNVDMDALTVTGNTFPVRQLMRELGMTWDKDRKAWTGSREALNAMCVKYA